SGTTLTGFTLAHDTLAATATLIHMKPDNVAMTPTIDGNAFVTDALNNKAILVDTTSTAAGARTFKGTISNNTFTGPGYGIYVSADLESGGTLDFEPSVKLNTFTASNDAIHFTNDAATVDSFTDSPSIVGNQSTGVTGNSVYYYVDAEGLSGTFQ